MSSDGVPVVAGGDQHLRIYHEYLSYVFRKPEIPSSQQQLEMGYRDYLQARQPIRLAPPSSALTYNLNTLKLPSNTKSTL